MINDVSTFVDLLRWRAQHQPEARAYSFLLDGTDEEATVSYAELDRRARAIGALLQDLGADGQRAMVLYPPGLDYLAAFFGCLYAGVVAVPAYPPQLNRPTPRLQAVVADAQATIALTTPQILASMQQRFVHVPDLAALDWLTTESLESGIEERWQRPEIARETLAMLQYTSGSTSTPKGVMLSHGNLLHNSALIYRCFGHTPHSRGVIWLPPYHDMGLIGGILQPLYGGFPVMLMPPISFLQRPLRWLQAITRLGGTSSGGPNFAYELCVRRITAEQRALLDLSSWEVAFTGAEPIRSETIERFTAAFAPCGFQPKAWYPCYGLAEATLIASGGDPAALPVIRSFQSAALEQHQAVAAPHQAVGTRRLVGCGHALAEQQIRVVDPDTLIECSDGRIGELWLAGPSVAQGYWQRPEPTLHTFGARIAPSGEGPFLRTGDLGFMHDDQVFITGRLKNLIIIRGRNFYPQDIELTVAQSHPALRPDAGAAFALDIDGQERLVVVQEIERGHWHDDPDAIVHAIREAVVEQHGVAVHGVALIKPGSIPKTSSNKIQHYDCRARYLANTLETVGLSVMDDTALDEAAAPQAAPELDRALLLASPPAERQAMVEGYLHHHIQRALKSPPIPADQPLRTLGIDSMMAVEIKNQIEVDLEAVLPFARILEGPSIAELARDIVTELAGAAPQVQPGLSAPSQRASEYPLSHGQQALFFLHQLAPESAAYNIARAVRLWSDLDVAALQRAFQALADRHPALRTTFIVRDGRMLQHVHEQIAPGFEVEDASALSEVSLAERLAVAAHRPFDLQQGPLLRVHLFTRSARDHVLLLAMHHIICDMWSLSIMMSELGSLYHAAQINVAPALQPQRLDYSDYVHWQAEMLASAEGERLWSYWQRQLAGELPVLNLPTNRPRPQVQTYRGATQSLRLDAALSNDLKALGLQQGATLYTTLLAAYAVLLMNITGQQEVMIGSPVANRTRAELVHLVGYLVNTVPLRIDLSGNPAFADVLGRVRQTVLDAFAHQEYPFDALVEQLRPNRDSSHSPLVQTMFVMQNAGLLHDQGLAPFALGQTGAQMMLGELKVESLALEQRTAQFDLTLQVAEYAGQLTLAFEYNTDLFDHTTISCLLGHFQTVVSALTEDSQRPVASVPLLTAAERHQLLVEWNATEVDYHNELRLHELIEAQVARTPQAIAVTFQSQQLSYQELNQRANQLARTLQAHGVGPEIRVGMLMERSIELVVGLLAILKAGGAYVPLDPTYPQERLQFMLEDAQVLVLLTQAHLLGPSGSGLPAHRASVICVDAEWETIAAAATTNLGVVVDADHPAYAIFTSGSTGQPKGAINTHRGICNRLLWMQATYQLTTEDRVLQKTPFSFDVSVWEFFWPLLTGARLVVAKPEGHKDSAYLVELIATERITTLHFVPSMLQPFLAEPDVTRCRWLKRVICSGEALPVHLQEQFFACFDAELHNLYGPTEAAVDVTFWQCSRDPRQRTVPIGRPVANTEIYILNDSGQPTPIGVPGELYIGGVQLGRGYLNRPALTATQFVPDPFSASPGARLYKTGDQARYQPDGTIEFLGRNDHQVKIRGFRIELEEIEAVLNRHPAIREAVVMAREDLPSVDGQAEKRLVGYVVMREQQALKVNELRRWLKVELPEYMVPSAFVVLDALPLTLNGKLDRRALPAPSGARPDLSTAFVAARTFEEEVLVGIWEEVLQRDQVGIDDNFFDLGGDSIRSIAVLARARERGVCFSLHDLFVHQTIRELAQALQSGNGSTPAPREIQPFELIAPEDRPKLPAEVEDAYPLTMLQTGLIFHSEYSADYEIYLTTLHLRAPFDLQALQTTLRYLVARYPMLRTAFDATSYHQPTQLVYRTITPQMEIFDLRHLSAAEQAERLEAWIQAEKKRAFSWAEPPLMRFYVHRRSDTSFQFTLCEPFFDGWSVASLLTEIFKTYIAVVNGADFEEAPLTSSFRDFVVLERAALTSEECRSYWERTLSDATVATLPRLSEVQPSTTHEIRRIEVAIPSEVSTGLKALARTAGVPLKSVLLAAHLKVMGFLTGQTDVLTGLIANGRPEQADGEKILGVFLNPIPLRASLAGSTWIELARQAFEREREALPFRRYPIAALQHAHGGQPLFEAVFNFTHFHAYHGIQRLDGIEVLDSYASEQTFFPLTTQFNLDHDAGSQVRLALDYNTGELGSAQVAEIGDSYLRALTEMARTAEQRHEMLDLLSERERRQVVAAWNDTALELPPMQTIDALVEAQATRTPEAVAVIWQDQQLSYAELEQRANQMAHLLQAHGVGPEVRVGVCLERSHELIIALLAILKAGGAYVPLDPAYPAERLQFMVEDAAVALLITQQTLPVRAALVAPAVLLEEIAAQRAAYPATPPVNTTEPANLAYLIYTSGSTGTPKGVAITHANTLAFLHWVATAFPPALLAGTLASTSVCFDLSVFEIFAPLTLGGAVIVAENALALPQLPAAERVTLINTVPSVLAELLRSGGLPSSVHTINLAGEPIPSALLTRLAAIPSVAQVFNLYGPSEDTTYSTWTRVEAGALVVIGRPIANTQVYVLDGQGQPVPIGVVGELHLGGAGLARGYFKRPALTATQFVPDPFSGQSGGRLYRTGDLARWRPDGMLDFLGRRDHQVKLRGFRIELGEIETVLARHPAVAEVVVLMHNLAADDPRLVAYVVAVPGTTLAVEELRQWAQAQLPHYMVPNLIVPLAALPLTPNGKLDRAALPAPTTAVHGERATPLVAARTPTEAEIVNIWRDVLQVEQVGIYDTFFELGGHSLLAMQVMSRLRNSFEVELPLQTIFETPTVAGLAAFIEARQAEEEAAELAWMIEQVQQFSDEEVRQKLSEKGWLSPTASLEE